MSTGEKVALGAGVVGSISGAMQPRAPGAPATGRGATGPQFKGSAADFMTGTQQRRRPTFGGMYGG